MVINYYNLKGYEVQQIQNGNAEKLATDSNAVSVEDGWEIRYKTFTNFIAAMPQGDNGIDKLNIQY